MSIQGIISGPEPDSPQGKLNWRDWVRRTVQGWWLFVIGLFTDVFGAVFSGLVEATKFVISHGGDFSQWLVEVKQSSSLIFPWWVPALIGLVATLLMLLADRKKDNT